MGYAARHHHGAAARARHAALLELQQEQRVRELAAQTPDEPALIKILDDCQPHLREPVKAALWPYLQFTPVAEPAPPPPVQEPLEEPMAVEVEGEDPARVAYAECGDGSLVRITSATPIEAWRERNTEEVGDAPVLD
jgi:hypothetical protein